MRNSERIDNFCTDLAILWKKNCTDLRFSQVVTLVFSAIEKEGKDPFYVEESEMIEYFRKCLER